MNIILGFGLPFAAVLIFISFWIYTKKKSALKKFYGKPAFGGVNAALGILVGYFGSHFDKEIFGATLRPYVPAWAGNEMPFPGTLTFGPIIFWPLAFFSAWGIYKSLTAQNETIMKVNDEFRAAFDRLFTMPSKGFLQVYMEAALASSKVTNAVPSSVSVDKLEEVIRNQLDNICKVVKRYDNEGLEFVYGCNVMLYYGSSTPEFLTKFSEIDSTIKCIERGVAIQNLAGVLQLKLPLSVRSDTSRLPDTKLVPLALPVAATGGTFDELDFIPGAPLTFASRAARVYQNQEELIGLLDSNRRFSSRVLDDLVSTLGIQNDSVQGLICIPLYDYFAPSPLFPIGVLNIHKNRSDEFISKKFSILEPLLAPLVQNLEKLLSVYPR